MEIIVCSFGANFKHFLDACVLSVMENMPDAKLKVIELNSPKRKPSIHHRFIENTVKLESWCDNMTDGVDTLFLDADTIVLGDVSEVFNHSFDIAYTKREHSIKRLPFNSGVVFARSKTVMRKWAEINRYLLNNPREWRKWNRIYIGYNQASFGYMLEKFKFNLMPVSSEIYNSCDIYDWLNNSQNAKIVHVKSDLRDDLTQRKRYLDVWGRIGKYYDVAKD